MLVSVPKILDVLREHVITQAGAAAREPGAQRRRTDGASCRAALVAAPTRAPAVRLEVLGVRRRARRRSKPSSRRSGASWASPSSRATGSRKPRRSSPSIIRSAPSAARSGKAIAGVEVKIAADGEILVRGENVTTGYFNAADETAQAFEDGWFHTGDIGEIGDGRAAVHPRPQEGDDRHAGRPERLPGGRRARAEPASPVCAIRPSSGVAEQSGAEERVHAVLVVEPGRAIAGRRSSGRRTRSSPIISRSAGRSSGRRRSCRAPKARASSSARRSATWVTERRTAAGCARPARDALPRSSRSYAGRGRSRADDHARGAWPELARARRADGRARGRVSDADRRGRVR